MSPVLQYLRHAARRLTGTPGFAAAAVLTLALGIAATTVAFSVVNTVLLRPLPYPAPDRLVSLSHTLAVSGELRVDQSDATVLFYQRHNRTFEHLGGYQVAAASLGPAGGGDAERVPAGRVSADLFPALRVPPLRGRIFTPSDDRVGAARVVVLSESLWMRKFGGDPSILTRAIDVDGVSHEIVGIMPVGFQFPAADTSLWVPLALDPAKTESASFDYEAVARLRDGVSIEQATSDLDRLLPDLPDEFPGRMTRASIAQTHMHASARPLAAVIVGDTGRLLWLMLGAAGFVLAISCANAANLFLVRAESRRTALAVQRALGAPPSAILIEFFSEGSLIAALGGALAIVAAAFVAEMLRSLTGVVDIPRLAETSLDSSVFGAAALIVILTALFVSLIPALRSIAASTASLLSSTSRSATAGAGRQRTQHALLVSQVALALVLLVGSGLMARSVWRLRSVPPGFDPSHAITFRVALPPAAYPGSDDAARFFTSAGDGIAGIPGVTAAGGVSKLPLDDQGRVISAVFVEDRPVAVGSLPSLHPLSYVMPGYFAAAGIPFMAGRTFTRPDPPRVLLEAIVSRAFAQRFWQDQSPIGKRVRIFTTGPWYSVVGVVGSVKDTALDQPADQLVYCPIVPAPVDPRWAPRDLAFVVRTEGDPAVVSRAVRGVIRGLDPSLPLYRVRSLSEIVTRASARRSFAFLLSACTAAAALLLGAIGLYGVMSYVVSLRMREIGIRLALGARPGAVRWMVSRQALVVTGLGIVIGLGGAVFLTRFLAALLFEVNPTDPAILAFAAIFLIVVAAAASWLPARRAATLDLARVLKAAE
jgi:putative ABC transport system permease protein